MKEIPLTRGFVAFVDDDDYERISQHKWRAAPSSNGDGNCYAKRSSKDAEGKYRTVSMHAEVLGGSPGMVDHVNGSGLDNRKCNLRHCTPGQNQANKAIASKSRVSRFKGVYWDKSKGRWRAELTQDGKRVRLGRFRSEEAAAKAYDEAAKRFHGEFARANF